MAPPLAQFSARVDLVEVYATVVDSKGATVVDLARSDFEVYEDGTLQTISVVAAGEFPLAVALAVDRSFSMAGTRLSLARSAAHAFLDELRRSDQVMVVAVGSQTEIVAPLGADRAATRRALASLDAWGTTGLHDAVIAAIDHIQTASGRRALILLSDGDDRYSAARAADALDRARRSDVLVYPIALGVKRPSLFAEMAALTGGRSFHLRAARGLRETLRAIATELRHQYLLGYAPARPVGPTPEWRSIQVRVKRPGLQVRARDGYLVQ